MQTNELGAPAEEYLQSLLDRGRKANTVACYRNNLVQCFRCLQAAGRPTDPSDITPDDVQYLWRTMDVKEEVRVGYLRTLARYVMHHTGRDPVKQADILRNRESRDRVFIDRGDFAVLMGAADHFQRMILVLGGMMGLRRAEMIGIRDRDVRETSIVIHGKGHGPDGLVSSAYMPPAVRSEIESYREWKRTAMETSGDGYLLQTRSRKGRLSKATPQQVSDAVRRLGQRCGIEVTTHSLRRLFATTLFYDAETDLQTVKTLMRHADVNTTLKCYIDADGSRGRTAVREVSRLLCGDEEERRRGPP